ncbi:MAG: patatin-like phospholipase family protein [Sporocytophaga sp.]|uniref:patatin-like phospholipase family protein n=1 Tax=Sporocytophaga sp. TaxID=2231183 RepID=UPI001B0B03C2|nr:patatin-like phospholipase family protein [Sporocytophaga sp.]MBO9701890.1 patatin-like phospholipase family protein [Sporocytophaga sp.]
MRLFYCFLLLLLCFSFATHAQTSERPKIGLVLSGGGAKGLGHIGILEVLDEVGLKVDYITGTSMGSIVGALYAMGYSADSIHKIAVSEKWDLLLSNQIPLNYLSPEDKAEYGQFNFEIGFEEKRVRMPNGLLEGHMLGLEFARLVKPVADRPKFTDYPIPFKCVATNIETGDIVVLDSGNIANALRASMAIPTFFTPVMYEGKYLIDGGVLRNFPVTEAKEMGADIVIGVNVSSGNLPANKLRSMTSVMYQSVSLAGSVDVARQKKLVDLLIEPDLNRFSVADFPKTEAIIKVGRETGDSIRTVLLALKDSLNALYPGEYDRNVQLPKRSAYSFSNIEVRGLKTYSPSYVISSLGLECNKPISCEELDKAMNQLMGTLNFRKINYEMAFGEDPDENMLIVHVIESSRYSAKLDFNYNTLFKTSFIFKFTARNLFLQNSRFYANFNIGDNIRVRSQYGKYFGLKRRSQLNFYGIFDQYDVPTTLANGNVLSISRLNKMNTYSVGLELQRRIANETSIHLGVLKENSSMRNLINSANIATYVQSSNFAAYLTLRLNTLNAVNYPSKGWKIYASASHVFDYRYRMADERGLDIPLVLPDLPLSKQDIKHNFQQVYASIQNYLPLTRTATLTSAGFAGFTYNTDLTLSHFYGLGGMRENFQRNIPFVGIKEFGHRLSPFLMNNVVSFQLGVQQQFFKVLYLTPRVNVATAGQRIDQFTLSDADPEHFLWGYGITFGFNSPGGPIEMSVMKSNQQGNFMLYFNIGYSFFNR